MSQNIEWLESQTPEQIMEEAIEKYNLDSLYVLFSGGKDSVCVAHFIATNYPEKFAGCVFTNTGLGSQETRKFVLSYCREMGWKLYMTWATTEKDRFYNQVMKYGFGFAGNHRQWMAALKFHSWRAFMIEKLKDEKACFVSGVRKKESKKREKVSGYTKTPIDVDGKLIFVKPFLFKNGTQLWDYFLSNQLKKTPVYDWLNRSGECYCGCFAELWDLQLFRTHDKLAFDTIKWLEDEIGLHGTHAAKKWRKWGMKSDTREILQQTTLNDDYCGESCYAE